MATPFTTAAFAKFMLELRTFSIRQRKSRYGSKLGFTGPPTSKPSRKVSAEDQYRLFENYRRQYSGRAPRLADSRKYEITEDCLRHWVDQLIEDQCCFRGALMNRKSDFR